MTQDDKPAGDSDKGSASPANSKEQGMETPDATTPTPLLETKPKEKDDATELLKAMLFAAFIALFIRSFLFEPFNIPSGSMFPTLLVGDYLFVEKYSYGYSKYSLPLDVIQFDGRLFESQPKRGDAAVFRQPKHPEIDYIKRIIGLPGDRLQMKEGRLYINGAIVQREFVGTENIKEDETFSEFKKYIETLPNGVRHYIYEISDDGPLDNTDEYAVPEGMYFAMGDNRDQSLDSRVPDQVGFVPAENLIGRAFFIFFSTEGTGSRCMSEGALAALKTVGCWLTEGPKAVRYNRIFTRVNKQP